jgi:DNA-binding NtrC family response regulator
VVKEKGEPAGSPEVASPTAVRGAPVIAIVDDDPIIRRVLTTWMQAEGFSSEEFETGGALMRKDGSSYAAVCLDLGLDDVSGIDVLRHLQAEAPEVPVIVLTARTSLDSAVEAMRVGAYDYVGKPFERDRVIHAVRRAVERSELARRARFLAGELSRERLAHTLVGESEPMRAVLAQVSRVLSSDAAVCLLGESGTGKEVVARAIHDQGRRSKGPFVAINCAAIPEHLQESELFGHERGAFTGATGTYQGCFERAVGGTLFLDELGDISPATQVKLLRALQEKTIRRVGGTVDIRTNVRILAATHRDLEAEVKANRFREDLYFRLMVYPIEIPALRERPDDIPLLVAHFLKRLRDDVGRDVTRVSGEAMDALLAHPWPGNVRELQNVVHRGMLSCPDDEIRLADLPPQVRRRVVVPPPPEPVPTSAASAPAGLPTIVLRDLEALAIAEALRRAEGSIPRAAKLLGLGRATLYRRLMERQQGDADPGDPDRD